MAANQRTKTLADLPTPCLVLDRSKLTANLKRMRDACERNNVRLRPHLKTAKSIDVAQLVLDDVDQGIAVSTLLEAEYFIQHGLRDIQYAVCITPDKLARVSLLQSGGAQVTIITDNVGVAKEIAAAGERFETRFRVQVEVDCGELRTGVEPASEDLLEIGRILSQAELVDFDGVMTHAGHSYNCRTRAEVEEVAEAERKAVVLAAERLAKIGIPSRTVSIGSTPTALYAAGLEGVSEVRAGVYMFGDMFQAQIGSCEVTDLAVSVLADVSSHRPDLGHFTIDAGALALSKDRSTERVQNDIGFGIVAGQNGSILNPQLTVDRVYQEHGLIQLRDGQQLKDFPIQSKLRIFPNHVCMTAAMYDRYYVVDSQEGDGMTVIAEWSRVNGW